MQASDLGTIELQKRGIVLGYTTTGSAVARVTHQTRLETLYHRGLIETEQYWAGRALQSYHLIAGFAVLIKSSADFAIRGGAGDWKSERCIEARERYDNAMALLTPAEKALVVWVVLDDGYLKDLKKSEPQYLHIGYALLRDGLDKLIKEFRI